METRIEMKGGGTLCLRQEGPRVHLSARRDWDGRGLYKVWLTGQRGGRCLLGTLTPEGKELRLERTLSLAELERAGCWPLAGAEAPLAFPFSGPEPWRREPHPERLTADPFLRELLRGPMLFRKGREGFQLAVPFRTDGPAALVPLICLARVEGIDGRPHLVWTFDGEGRPKSLYKGPGGGED